jgi:hypothetical protein
MSVTSEIYLARADECAREAGEAMLDNVRERCLRSEEAWRSMAQRVMRGEKLRDAAAAKVSIPE